MLEDPKKYGDEFGTRDLAVVLQDRISDQVRFLFRCQMIVVADIIVEQVGQQGCEWAVTLSPQCLAEPGSQAVIQHKLHCHLLTRTHPYLRLVAERDRLNVNRHT